MNVHYFTCEQKKLQKKKEKQVTINFWLWNLSNIKTQVQQKLLLKFELKDNEDVYLVV